MTLPPLSFITGGARSGKSRFAENLIAGSGRPKVYIATAEPWDAEMADRIRHHRDSRGTGWRTIEAPRDLPGALRNIAPHEAVLIDCATLWLSNLMLDETDLAGATSALRAALFACAAPVVIVSNEVGWSIVPENKLARRFRDEQGRLNQALAADADLAVAVMSGLPLVLKGSLT